MVDLQHSAYKKLPLKRFPISAKKVTSEARFWKSFKNPKLISHIAKVSDINFSPVSPHDLAVSTSTRVVIYDGKTAAEKKTITRFRDVAYSGCFRSDGKLLIAGTGDSYVKVFDVASRTVLRHFKGHKDAVHVAGFSQDPTEVMSASDDGTVRIWDMPTYKHKLVFKGHRDYIRCAIEGATASTWISGSFDHSVRLWDTRSGKVAMTMDQESPVESVLLLPGGGLVAAAGHNGIKIWDMVNGGRVLHSLENHRKAVTCLALDSTNSRLVSGSADQHIKFLDLESYEVTHSMLFPSPVLSVGISPQNTMMAVGLADGTLSLRHREVSTRDVEAEERSRKTANLGSRRFFRQVETSSVEVQDFSIKKSGYKQRLAEHDQYLKTFQHHKALDAALNNGNPCVVASMFEELLLRDRLESTLSGRDEQSILQILAFLTKHITTPRYSKLLIGVSNVFFDIYGALVGQSMLVDEAFVQLRRRVDADVRRQVKMAGLIGSIEMLRSASSVRTLNIDQQMEEGTSA